MFSSVIEKERRGIMERLKATAHTANRLAKTAEGGAKRSLYVIKSRAVTRLLELKAAQVGEVLFEGSVIVGLWFSEGSGLHIRLKDLSPRGQRIVLEQLEKMLDGQRLQTNQENQNE